MSAMPPFDRSTKLLNCSPDIDVVNDRDDLLAEPSSDCGLCLSLINLSSARPTSF